MWGNCGKRKNYGKRKNTENEKNAENEKTAKCIRLCTIHLTAIKKRKLWKIAEHMEIAENAKLRKTQNCG